MSAHENLAVVDTKRYKVIPMMWKIHHWFYIENGNIIMMTDDINLISNYQCLILIVLD